MLNKTSESIQGTTAWWVFFFFSLPAPNMFLVYRMSEALSLSSEAPSHCINFRIQNSMSSIYSGSREKSWAAQMLPVKYGSCNKELSLGTAALCHLIHEPCQRTTCSLRTPATRLCAQALDMVESVFHTICITYPGASHVCYSLGRRAQNSVFPFLV